LTVHTTARYENCEQISVVDWKLNNRRLTVWLFCVRIMNSMPCALSKMMLCMLKLTKHRVLWSLSLYCRHTTCLG